MRANKKKESFSAGDKSLKQFYEIIENDSNYPLHLLFITMVHLVEKNLFKPAVFRNNINAEEKKTCCREIVTRQFQAEF